MPPKRLITAAKRKAKVDLDLIKNSEDGCDSVIKKLKGNLTE